MVGIPLNAAGDYTGGLFDLLNPYSLVTGVLAVAVFALHGTLFLYLKTEGELQERLRGWMWKTFFPFLALYVVTTAYTLLAVPRATANFEQFPLAAAIALLTILAVANVPRCIYRGKPGWAFISSTGTIAGLCFLFGVALFPNLVTASNNPDYSLTIYNAASSEKTLGIMLLIAIIGMPFVLAYTGVIYWTFRGKVEIGDHSY
jgi:cytochrome d ubiquinol oxidase subunit II